MKKTNILIILLLIILVIASINVSARKGVGIVWTTEAEIVEEGIKHCIPYGIYNPWDEDVNAYLDITGGLEEIIVEQEVSPRLIKANTMHDQAVPINFCFATKKIYEDNCFLGMLCEQKCDKEQTEFFGDLPLAAVGRVAGNSIGICSVGILVTRL